MLSSKGPLLSTTIMRAVVVSKFGDPDVLEVRRDAPIPTPDANEVLVKVAAIGVNPVDTYIRSGNYGRLPTLPYVPGSDMSGTVISVGANVKDFKEGEKVASFMKVKSGAYAEYCVVYPEWLVRLPPTYDFCKGAAVGTPFFTAYKALFIKAKARPSDIVLIHGASGGVGIAASQLAVSRGMTVFGTAGSKSGVDVVKSNGVEHVFNHKEEGYTDQIMKATNGAGVDIILEMLSNVNLNEDLKLLAPGGTVLVIGCRGPIEINPRLMMGKESKIEGVALAVSTKEELSDMKRAIQAGLSQGWIDPGVGVKMSLNNVQQAHRDIIHNEGAKGKLVLVL